MHAPESNFSLLNRVANDSGDGAIVPTWTAVDTANVKTSRELWEHMKNLGWNVDVRQVGTFLFCRVSDILRLVLPVRV